jgi:UMF1 family MFS transporter
VALFGFVGLGLDDSGPAEAGAESIRATAFLVAGWYLAFAAPLLLVTRDRRSTGKPLSRAVPDGWNQLVGTIKHVRRYGPLLRFLIAHLVYNDGLATLFAMGGVYAAGTFDMTESEILMFGIALNVTAAVGAISFGWVDDWIGGRKTIVLSLVGLIVPGIAVLLVESKPLFWACCLVLGIFVGPVQAASRSFLARVAPADLRNQAFGLYALSGKATAFQGPLLVGWLTWWSGSQRIGMSAIVVLFVVGLAVMATVPDARNVSEP